MAKRGLWAALLLLALVACPVACLAASTPDKQLGPAAYLSRALDILQASDVFSARVHWPEERQRLEALLQQDPSIGNARQLIEHALADLDDGHGALLPPGGGAPSGQSSPAGSIVPHGRMLPRRIGYLLLPGVSADPDSEAATAYARRGEELVRSLAAHGASAWIIDLRYDTGGDMYPMLVAVAALLDPGRVLGFQPNHGQRTWVTYDRSAFYADGVKIMAAPTPEMRLQGHPLVALLTSSQTASSGEATLIAFLAQRHTRTFGQATHGVPNAPTTVRLSDGYTLEYSAATDIDRAGHVYLGPINPQSKIAVPSTFVTGDPELHAAQTWIAQHRPDSARQPALGIAAALALLQVLALIGARVRARHVSD